MPLMLNHILGPRKTFLTRCTAGQSSVLIMLYRSVPETRIILPDFNAKTTPRGCCHIPSLNLLVPANFYSPLPAVRERASSGRQPLLLPGIGGR